MNSKLDMFLELALMDRQFALVVAKNWKEQVIEVTELLTRKKFNYKISSDVQVLFETGDEHLILFEINPQNFQKILKDVRKIRLNGFLPDGLKIIFTIAENLLKEQTDEIQDQILCVFSPIFRFDI